MQNLSVTNILEKSNTKELSSKKLEGGKKFQLITEYTPAGDQPKAISFLKTEILNNKKKIRFCLESRVLEKLSRWLRLLKN